MSEIYAGVIDEIGDELKRIVERLERLEFEVEKLKNPEGQNERKNMGVD